MSKIECVEKGRTLFEGRFYILYEISVYPDVLYTVGKIKQQNDFIILLERSSNLYIIKSDKDDLAEKLCDFEVELFGPYVINLETQTFYHEDRCRKITHRIDKYIGCYEGGCITVYNKINKNFTLVQVDLGDDIDFSMKNNVLFINGAVVFSGETPHIPNNRTITNSLIIIKLFKFPCYFVPALVYTYTPTRRKYIKFVFLVLKSVVCKNIVMTIMSFM